MKINGALLLSLMLIIAVTSIIIWQKFKYDWNPHYLNNDAVIVDEYFYSPDSSVAVLYYTLDIGARGLAQYKSVLRKGDEQGDLMKYNLPPVLLVQKWKDNNILEVIYDEYQGFLQGGGLTDLSLSKDTVIRNGVTVLILERRMNKKERLKEEMR